MEAENFQFKIQIQDISKPPVWRRVTIPSNYSFYDFHYIIQTVFGWTNSHMFQFSEKGFASRQIITELYEDIDPGDKEQIEATDVKLSEIFKKEKQKFIYIYDFGDSWEHTIILEKILPEKTIWPALVDGKGKCPPEDCDGVWGYENFKKVMANRKHPEYEKYAELCELEDGEKWDPNEFDLNQMQSLLNKMSSER